MMRPVLYVWDSFSFRLRLTVAIFWRHALLITRPGFFLFLFLLFNNSHFPTSTTTTTSTKKKNKIPVATFKLSSAREVCSIDASSCNVQPLFVGRIHRMDEISNGCRKKNGNLFLALLLSFCFARLDSTPTTTSSQSIWMTSSVTRFFLFFSFFLFFR